MIFCFGRRSAKTPPNGDSSTVGIMDTARIVPNTAADPVTSRTYSESEKRRIALPNSEIICPRIIIVKSR